MPVGRRPAGWPERVTPASGTPAAVHPIGVPTWLVGTPCEHLDPLSQVMTAPLTPGGDGSGSGARLPDAKHNSGDLAARADRDVFAP